MTNREAAIVSAYTKYFIGDLGELYKYLSEFIGRPIYTHEMPRIAEMYQNKIKQDFVSIKVED